VKKARERARVGTSVRLRPDAEAGHGLGDTLVVPAHPVALAEFGSGLQSLVLIHRALDDLLILVVVVLELTGRMNLKEPDML
jgi:hypothetical protein